MEEVSWALAGSKGCHRRHRRSDDGWQVVGFGSISSTKTDKCGFKKIGYG
jgi:hypothetical protein